MQIKIQRIDFSKETKDLGNDVLFIELNGVQLSIKDEKLYVKTNETLIIELSSSNVVKISEKK